MSNRDNNYIPTLQAWNEVTQSVENVRIDPLTDEILVEVYYAPPSTPASINRALQDDDYVPSAVAVEDTSGNLDCLRCDTNNNILVDLL